VKRYITRDKTEMSIIRWASRLERRERKNA